MTRVRTNGGFIGINFSPNTIFQSGIWSITEHEKYAIGNPTFWNSSVFQADVLLVGAGGSGGYGRGALPAGGGGGGGVFYKQNVQIANNSTYTITVGAATARATSSGARYSGSDTTFNGIIYGYSNATIVAVGGGGGGAPVSCGTGGNDNGLSGGSGGGGGNGGGGPYSAAVASGGAALQPTKVMVGPNVFIGGGYGNDGSGGSGGGGGGGGVGLSRNAGNMSGVRRGGAGIEINANGTPTYFAGGGGAGSSCIGSLGGLGGGGAGGGYFGYAVSCRDGATNRGGGGGAGGGSGDVTGGAGGSGIAMVSYANNFGLALSTTGSPTILYVGPNIVYTFLSSGSLTF